MLWEDKFDIVVNVQGAVVFADVFCGTDEEERRCKILLDRGILRQIILLTERGE